MASGRVEIAGEGGEDSDATEVEVEVEVEGEDEVEVEGEEDELDGLVDGDSGRALFVARVTRSDTTDKSGEEEPFIKEVPVAAVTTLRRND